MNTRTTFSIVAILAAVGIFSTSVFAVQEQACPDCVDDQFSGVDETPIQIWTDSEVYNSGSIILVNGKVQNIRLDDAITLQVIAPNGNRVSVAQVMPDADGNYMIEIKTGGKLWKYDGIYTIKVTYGAQEINNKVLVELTGGIIVAPTTPSASCNSDELSASGRCIPFSISGASATSARLDSETNSLIVKISSNSEGTLTVDPASDAIRGIFMVLVDGEESNDVTINGNEVTVMFPDGAEEIEIIGTYAIPEFGTISAMILAVAFISIIAVTAKTRLRILSKH